MSGFPFTSVVPVPVIASSVQVLCLVLLCLVLAKCVSLKLTPIVVVPPGYCMVALQTLIINTQIRFIKHTGSPDCSQTASQLARQLYPNPGCSLLVGILSSLMSPMVVLRSSDESLWESSGLQVSSSKSSACQCLTLTVSSLSA